MANPSIQLGTNSNWAVKEDKLLAYKEYNDYFFNKEFDFSRGTSATYVAKDGLIKTAGIQPNIVQNGDFSELGPELVTNGTFDTDSDWTKGSGWSIANGKASYDGLNGTQQIFSNTGYSAVIGKTYKITFNVLSQGNGNNTASFGGVVFSNTNLPVNSYEFYVTAVSTGRFGIFGRNGGVFSIDNVSVKEVGQNWTVANEDANNYVEFNQEEGTVRLKFLNTSPITTLSSATQYLSGKTYKLTVDVKEVVSGSIKVDAAGVSETFNSVGIQQRIIEPTGNATINFYRATANVDITLNSVSLQEIQTDTPRIDFTNDTKGHLLLEPQSTNLLQRSNEFDNSYWGKANVTVTANSAISPDGTNNAFLLDVGTVNGEHSLRKSGLSPTATYTVSIFAKKGSTDYVWFLCGGASKGVQAIFDLSDGSVTDSGLVGSGQTLIAAKSVDMGNGWYRLIMEAETTSAPTNNLTVSPYYQSTFNGKINTHWQGNNETIYVYGAMNEESSFATSYIPTTSATVTRNADVCNNSGSAQDFNDSEGVLYAEIAALESTFSGSKFISISDGTYNNRASILFSNGATNKIRTFLRVGGVSQVDKSGNVTDVKDFNKVAFSYKENEFKMFINGSQVGSPDTSGSVWSSGTITKLSLTEINSALGAFNGKVRNVQVFTEALTDAELQELTS